MLTADLGPGVWAAFTTRAGGRSDPPYEALNLGAGVGDDAVVVAANRRLLDEQVGAPVTFLRQTHSAQVLIDPDPGAPAGQEPVADGLVLTAPGRAAAVLVADCLPVLLAGMNRRDVPVAVAAVHAGRRGVLADIVTRAVSRLREACLGPVRAAIGPAICGRCYEVPEQMHADSVAVLAPLASRTSWGTPALDLRAGVRAQLEQAGVAQIDDHDVCTREDPALYSYRRDGRTGRFAGVVRLDRHAESLGPAGPESWSSV